MERYVYAVCPRSFDGLSSLFNRLKRDTVQFFVIISNIIPRQVRNGSYTEGLIIGDFFCGLNLGDFGGHFTIALVWLQCSLLPFEVLS